MIKVLVLCASDYHLNHEFAARTLELIKKHKPELFLYCGDFVSQEYAEELLNGVEALGVRALAVSGNLDVGIFHETEKTEIVTYGVRKVNDYNFFLVSALHPFFVEDAVNEVKGMDNRKLVFVTHYPPKGIQDRVWNNEHVGYEGYRKFVDKIKPLAHIFGHIHEDNGYTKLNDTIFINCAATPSKRIYFLNLKTLEVRAVKL